MDYEYTSRCKCHARENVKKNHFNSRAQETLKMIPNSQKKAENTTIATEKWDNYRKDKVMERTRKTHPPDQTVRGTFNLPVGI